MCAVDCDIFDGSFVDRGSKDLCFQVFHPIAMWQVC